VESSAQLGDRGFDLFRRDDACAQSAMKTERGRVALTGQDASRARSFAGPQHRALRPIVIDDHDGFASQIGLAPPHQLERQRREIETRELHLFECSANR
jgi:hypothetical protein